MPIGGAHDDPPPGARAGHGPRVLGQPPANLRALEAGLPLPEMVGGQLHVPALIGDEVDPLLTEPGEERAVVAAAVEDQGQRTVAGQCFRTARTTPGKDLANEGLTAVLTVKSGRPRWSPTKYSMMPGKGIRRCGF